MGLIIEGGTDVRHGPPVALLNRMLSFVSRLSNGAFLATTVVCFSGAAAALAIALFFAACWCVDDGNGEGDGSPCARAHFGRLLLLCLRQLTGSGSEYLGERGAARAPAECAALAVAGNFCGLLLQAMTQIHRRLF